MQDSPSAPHLLADEVSGKLVKLDAIWIGKVNTMVNAIFLFVIGVIGTIALSIISNAIWEWMRDTISIPSTKYIDMRGEWKIASSYELNGARHNLEERMDIKQQFTRRFRGTIFSPHPTNLQEYIELDVRGEFKDKFHVQFWYEHRTSKLTDIGAGILQINADHVTAEGASVNFGVSSPRKPAIISFNMSKFP